MSGCVPVDRLRALVKLLGPEHLTPVASRQIRLLCDEYERADTDARPAPRIVGDDRRR